MSNMREEALQLLEDIKMKALEEDIELTDELAKSIIRHVLDVSQDFIDKRSQLLDLIISVDNL